MRNARANMNIAPSKKASLIIVMQDESKKELFEKSAKYFISVGATTDVRFENQANIAEDAIKVVTQYANLYIPTGDLIDVQKEMQRLEKEREKLLSEIDRVVKKLANESFVAKAPQKLVDEEKAKKEKYEKMLEEVEEAIGKIKK